MLKPMLIVTSILATFAHAQDLFQWSATQNLLPNEVTYGGGVYPVSLNRTLQCVSVSAEPSAPPQIITGSDQVFMRMKTIATSASDPTDCREEWVWNTRLPFSLIDASEEVFEFTAQMVLSDHVDNAQILKAGFEFGVADDDGLFLWLKMTDSGVYLTETEYAAPRADLMQVPTVDPGILHSYRVIVKDGDVTVFVDNIQRLTYSLETPVALAPVEGRGKFYFGDFSEEAGAQVRIFSVSMKTETPIDAECDEADFNGDTIPGDIFDLFDFLAALDACAS